MKHKLPIIVGVAALAIALMVWRWRGDESTTESASRDTTGKTAARAATRRVDPRTLARGLISGNVRDENKLPIAGATVCADIKDEELPSSLRRESVCTSSDAHGAYVLRELLASTYVVIAGAKSYRPSSATLVLAGGESKLGIDLTLSSGGVEVTGTVSDIGGGPIAGAKVRVRDSRPDAPRSPAIETDDHGTFSVWTDPGAARIRASADPARMSICATRTASPTRAVGSPSSVCPEDELRLAADSMTVRTSK